MGIEFSILKDLATITNTAVELSAINQTIKNSIKTPSFVADYNALISDINGCYKVVINNLEPMFAISTESEFKERFQSIYRYYIESYLSEISRPREYAECVYEKNLQFRKLKEVNTSFPILKRNFCRLHELIDKWLDNDIWLAMTIDSLFKLLARFLNEVNDIADKDLEDAFLVYYSGTAALFEYFHILGRQVAELSFDSQ